MTVFSFIADLLFFCKHYNDTFRVYIVYTLYFFKTVCKLVGLSGNRLDVHAST